MWNMLCCVVVKHWLWVNTGFRSWPGSWSIGEGSNVKRVLCCVTRYCIVLCGARSTNATVDNIAALPLHYMVRKEAGESKTLWHYWSGLGAIKKCYSSFLITTRIRHGTASVYLFAATRSVLLCKFLRNSTVCAQIRQQLAEQNAMKLVGVVQRFVRHERAIPRFWREPRQASPIRSNLYTFHVLFFVSYFLFFIL